MLSAILKKETCADCRFCCVFRRCSLWETPLFTKENIEAIKADPALDPDVLLADESGDYAGYDLSDKYLTEDTEEEAPCPYLGEKGCVLSDEEKPWDCKIWPLRVMKKTDGEVVVALTPTCPHINKLDLNTVRDFVKGNLKDELLNYADAHPYLIKEYREGYPVM